MSITASALFIQGCSSPQLQPWHTEKLKEEFTAADAADVQSFDDYLQLEKRLFAELDTKVYAAVDTGPAFTLARYSNGSLADPRNDQPNFNRSFVMTAAEPLGAVLLLHGMSDSPYSLRALAQTLSASGYTVLGLRMPGHGTAPSGLKYVQPDDMTAAVTLGMNYLGSVMDGKPAHIIGYSTGATLALNFALDSMGGEALPIPASLILISPAIRISATATFAGFKNALSSAPGLGGLAWLGVMPEFDPYKYNSFATNATNVVHQLTRSVDSKIAARVKSAPGNILPPTLILKSTVDSTVTTEAVVDNLLNLLQPNRHELVLFDINRAAAIADLMESDPGPLTRRLEADSTLPFAVSIVTNANPASAAVVVNRKNSFSDKPVSSAALGLEWPADVLSLSHVALPFPPDDPLYGRQRPPDHSNVFLGDIATRGERGLLKLPGDWVLRMRYNPFYDYLETRVLDWLSTNTVAAGAGQ